MADEKVCHTSWQCKICTMYNSKYLSYCEICLTPKHGQQKETKQTDNVIAITSVKNRCGKKWKCKLCSMENNKYISYCEECLVPINVQKNKVLFNQLKSKLNSCHQYIKADEIREMIGKLKDDFRRLKMYQTDKQIVPEIQQQIKTLYAKMGIKCEPNIVHDFIETYNIDNNGFKKQRKSNKKCHPVCKCGIEMKSMKSNECYRSKDSWIICDICDQPISSNGTLFHCPQQKVPNIHAQGFDICLKCREKHIHRLRYFVAVIICPKMAENHIGKDAETLALMFKKLGFHKIICLKGDDVNKYTVKHTLNSVLPKDGDENVNQFTAICYSGHGDLDENNNYYFAIDPRDENTWISSGIIKNQCQALQCGAVIDGYKKYFNQFWYKTYYRHNTLLLVNSCHSGGISSQLIANSFVETSALGLLLTMFGVTIGALHQAVTKLSAYLGKTAVDCIKHCCNGCVPLEAICECFGITVSQFVAIAALVGVAVIVVIIVAVSIYKARQKSKECESIYVIASCQTEQESNTVYGMSPFMRHCTDFFDIFLNPEQNKKLGNGYTLNAQYLMDCPLQLLKYLEASYEIHDQRLGGISLNYIGQTVCASKSGFNQFAMCPILKQN